LPECKIIENEDESILISLNSERD